jgi:tetratricopeptide (TPR) repeat protein
MRRLLTSLSLVLLALAAPKFVYSQEADSSVLFLNAYMANQQGEQLETSGDTRKALSKYRYAASLLEEISRDDPKWQPLVVDYRKQKVMDNISRLQIQIGSQGSQEPPPDQGPPSGEPPMPSKGDDILPTPNLNSTEPAPDTSADASAPSGASQQARDQLEAMQDELRDSQKRLKAVESEKEDMAARLQETLKQLDSSRINETELKGQLQQAQAVYQNAVDHNLPGQSAPPTGDQKTLQSRVSQLEEALKSAEAEREAADEQNEDYARRNAKVRQASSATAQQLAEANAQNKALAAKLANTAKLVSDLDAAKKQIAALTQAKNDAQAKADDLDVQLSSASKTAEKLAAAEKEIAALKSGNQQTAAKGSAVAAQLADAHKQIDQLTKDRDAARDQVTSLTGELADANKQIVSVKADRDSVAAQRDQALADLAKAREASKHVDQLIADNATLTQKLAADDKIIKDFKSDSPEKDKQIADLRKEVSDTKALLVAAQQERDNVQTTLNQLQQQYDSTSSELTELKANSKISSSEKQTLTDENSILRGIVLRQLKEQARRDQIKRLVMTDLSDLKIQSNTLLQRINYLGEPVVHLTDKEKSLFKDPDVDLSDSDDSPMNIDISAPRQSLAHDPPADSPAPALPSNTPAPPVASSTPADLPPSLAASPSPSGTPMDLAAFSSPKPAFSPEPEQSPVPEDTAPPGGGGMAPGAPPGLGDDARAAKDAFDRGKYRDAERMYEEMLVKNPNNLYTLSNLGVAYFRDEKFKLAEESLKKAIAVAPEDTFSHCTLGIVYYREQHFDDAINELTRALEINKNYAVAHNYLGITASQKGWQEAAVKELQTAVDIDPRYADAWFNLAVVYAMQKPPNVTLARQCYQKAVGLGAEPDSNLEGMLK